jgi:hydrogenase/urease accessory protein HupE
MRTTAWIAPLALLAGAPGIAHAHLVNSGLGPFYNGTLHLLLSPADGLAVLAVGLLAGQGGKASARAAAITLPLAWGGAALAGLMLDRAAEPGWLEVALLILLGVSVAARVRLPAWVLAPVAALIGFVHGLENAGALIDSDGALVAVAGIATAVSVLTLLTGALAVSLRAAWTRVALQVGGSWIASVGMLMLGWLLQGTS